MPEEPRRSATIGEIARRTGYPAHKVAYVIRTRGLEPAERAGNLRVFSESDVQFIGCELRRIEAERVGGGLVHA